MPLLVDQRTGEFECTVEPVSIGPTWHRHPEWTEDDPIYIVPDHVGVKTLGWTVLAWVHRWLIDPELSDPDRGIYTPFRLTDEQQRFILWWYAVDDRGRFRYRRGILQRLKGWGKDPLAAILALVEFVGPCRFDGWDADGEPIAKIQPNAFVQIAAVTQEQTDNTMSLIPSYMSPEFRQRYGIEDLKLTIWSRTSRGRARIKAVTSNPRPLEGNRPTFIILNETHHWLTSNNGVAMYKVLTGNVTKSKGGTARMLAITNAYEPGEESVARTQREAWQAEQDGLAPRTRVLYDSLEAPSDARVVPTMVDMHTRKPILNDRGDPIRPTDEMIEAYLTAVITAVRGDASWLDVETIVAEIMDVSNPPSDSRRKYFNQVVGAEDRWLDKAHLDAATPEWVREIRMRPHTDPLRCTWRDIDPDEPIVMFGDGSKTDDSTGLVGMVVRTGFTFTIGVWQKPKGDKGKGWRAPRGEVDARVDEAMQRFNIIGFLFDPSHTKDDEDSTPYWDAMVDGWHQRYGDKLLYWAVQGGDRTHSVRWDMTSPERQKEFVLATERWREELIQGGLYTIDAHPALIEHMLNARVNIANKWGHAIMKEHRESARKIDLAVCAIGASMLRRFVLNKGLDKTEEESFAWWAPVPGYDSL